LYAVHQAQESGKINALGSFYNSEVEEIDNRASQKKFAYAIINK
jgi:hypothetical protein